MKISSEAKSGFTLIELLVVVLIIGILAAIALPQYQVSVMKSRLVQLKTMVQSIKEAENIYRMERGEFTNRFSDLTLDIGGTGNYVNVRNFDWGVCAISNDAATSSPGAVVCNNRDGLGMSYDFINDVTICMVQTALDADNTPQQKVCRGETGGDHSNVTITAVTQDDPEGTEFKGYTY